MEPQPGTIDPTYLRSMPLHGVTEIYGQEGLRQRLSLDVNARFDPEGQALINQALLTAEFLHGDDTRTREPYMNHLLRVAIRLMTYYDIDDADAIAAALLHDSIEDHHVAILDDELVETDDEATRQAKALDKLSEWFNPRIAKMVADVTNPPFDPSRDKHEQYVEHVTATVWANPWARVHKVSDFTDNAVGIIWSDPDFAKRQAPKYLPLIDVFREVIILPDTPLSQEAKIHILEQLDLGEVRLRALIPD